MANSVEVDLPLKHGAAHYIVSEGANEYISREVGTIASGAGKLVAGTVLGRVTATGEFKGFNPAATDGSQTAAAILYQDVDARTKAVKRTITARHTEVQRAALSFVGAFTDNQKAAAYASLAVNSIVMR